MSSLWFCLYYVLVVIAFIKQCKISHNKVLDATTLNPAIFFPLQLMDSPVSWSCSTQLNKGYENKFCELFLLAK